MPWVNARAPVRSESERCPGLPSTFAFAVQEANQKQRQQFKGLFDKKPGGLTGGAPAASGGLAQAPPKMRRTLNDTDGSGPPEGAPRESLASRGEDLSEFKDLRGGGRKGSSWLAWLPSFVFFVILATSSLSLLKGIGRQEL